MAKDLIVGVVDNYDWDKIKYWSNSIEQSGFDGYKALIVYNMDAATAKKLTEKQSMLIGCSEHDETKGFVFKNKSNIMVDRFMYIHHFLSMLQTPDDVNRVIITDVRDVVFQTNPTTWLDEYFIHDANILVGSENLTYENEPWGKNNIKTAFGEYFYEKHKDLPIYCAGVIAGELNAISDLCQNIWLICRGLNPHVEGGGGPDQAALNIILNLEVYSFSTYFSSPACAWVLHAGTSMNAIKAGSGGIGEEYIRNPNMKIDFINDLEYTVIDNKVCWTDKPITVLHQWDRVPEWKKMIEENYGAN